MLARLLPAGDPAGTSITIGPFFERLVLLAALSAVGITLLTLAGIVAVRLLTPPNR